MFKNRKDTGTALLFGCTISSLNLAGKYLETNLAISNIQFLYLGINTVTYGMIIGEIYLRLRAYIERSCIKRKFEIKINRSKDMKYFFWCVCILLIAYIPVFLAYYPGLFAYDVMSQIPQSIGSYHTHHPLIHTLYLQFFYYVIGGKVLHSYTAGIACATVVQVMLFSCMLSYVHLFLYRARVSKCMRMIWLVLTAILPFFQYWQYL